ncbi:MAG: MFS transporter, partial [Anaerolineae bacterium]|nr:MFS transporter [Anaerolineae bacterium]
MTDKRNLHPFTLLGIAFVAFIAIGLPPGLLNIAWTYMHNTFGVSFESLGILLTVATIGRLVSAFTSGRLSASTGLGVYMAIGSLCEALGALGFILVPSWEALLLAAMVASFGSGMIDAGLN